MTIFNAYEIERLQTLHGVALASFARRAFAFLADFVILCLLFIVFMIPVEMFLHSHDLIKSDKEIVFALNLNWYSIAWVVAYFGLATYFGNGKTPGKWLLGIRTVSLARTLHDRTAETIVIRDPGVRRTSKDAGEDDPTTPPDHPAGN